MKRHYVYYSLGQVGAFLILANWPCQAIPSGPFFYHLKSKTPLTSSTHYKWCHSSSFSSPKVELILNCCDFEAHIILNIMVWNAMCILDHKRWWCARALLFFFKMCSKARCKSDIFIKSLLRNKSEGQMVKIDVTSPLSVIKFNFHLSVQFILKCATNVAFFLEWKGRRRVHGTTVQYDDFLRFNI